MITLGLALFDNNNRLITLRGGYKNLHYLTQFIVIVQHFTCIKNNKIYLKNLRSVVCCLFANSSSSKKAHSHNAFGSLLLYVAHHDKEFVEHI